LIIEVDDAGIGELLGGVYFCFNNITYHHCIIKSVDVKYFQNSNFKKRLYLNETEKLTRQALKELNLGYHLPDETIEFHICLGWINNLIAKVIQELGFKVIRKQITGETQQLVETAYNKYLENIGIKNIRATPSAKNFHAFREWVAEDLNRERYVKTGWPSWYRKWRPQQIVKTCGNCQWIIIQEDGAICTAKGKLQGYIFKQALNNSVNCIHWSRKIE